MRKTGCATGRTRWTAGRHALIVPVALPWLSRRVAQTGLGGSHAQVSFSRSGVGRSGRRNSAERRASSNGAAVAGRQGESQSGCRGGEGQGESGEGCRQGEGQGGEGRRQGKSQSGEGRCQSKGESRQRSGQGGGKGG